MGPAALRLSPFRNVLSSDRAAEAIPPSGHPDAETTKAASGCPGRPRPRLTDVSLPRSRGYVLSTTRSRSLTLRDRRSDER
jgi:hypothetical protein